MTSDVRHTVRHDQDEQTEQNEGQSASASATGSGTRYSIVRKHATTIARLPDPTGDEPWFRLSEVDLSYSLLLRLKSSGAVKSDRARKGKKWRLKENIYEEATAHAEDRETFDCGCTGINNIPGGGIECSGCGIEYPRTRAKEVLSSNE